MGMQTILIVEDDPIFALDLQDMVWESGGNPVGPARCMQGALELCSRYPVDLAIIDINLTDGRSGLRLAKLLGEQFGVRTIIVSSDLPSPGDVKDTEYTFVPKPVPPAVLAAMIAPLTQTNGAAGSRSRA